MRLEHVLPLSIRRSHVVLPPFMPYSVDQSTDASTMAVDGAPAPAPMLSAPSALAAPTPAVLTGAVSAASGGALAAAASGGASASAALSAPASAVTLPDLSTVPRPARSGAETAGDAAEAAAAASEATDGVLARVAQETRALSALAAAASSLPAAANPSLSLPLPIPEGYVSMSSTAAAAPVLGFGSADERMGIEQPSFGSFGGGPDGMVSAGATPMDVDGRVIGMIRLFV
jgi:hypothetical protein